MDLHSRGFSCLRLVLLLLVAVLAVLAQVCQILGSAFRFVSTGLMYYTLERSNFMLPCVGRYPEHQ